MIVYITKHEKWQDVINRVDKRSTIKVLDNEHLQEDTTSKLSMILKYGNWIQTPLITNRFFLSSTTCTAT